MLLSIETYRRLTKTQGSILDMLADPEAAHVPFEEGRVDGMTRPVDLS